VSQIFSKPSIAAIKTNSYTIHVGISKISICAILDETRKFLAVKKKELSNLPQLRFFYRHQIAKAGHLNHDATKIETTNVTVLNIYH